MYIKVHINGRDDLPGNMESQIGEADFNGERNKKLLAILTRKQMWCE